VDQLLAAIRLVALLTGALRPTGEATESQLKIIRELIARCLFYRQEEPFFGTEDPVQLSEIAELEAEELSRIREICTSVKEDFEEHPFRILDVRVFRRELPIISEMPEACPAWAAGAAATESFGPFVGSDHRPVWFTIYGIERLIALRGPTGDAPLLFFPHINGLAAATDFTFTSGSVWISAPLLASQAPADGYCGLRVSEGNVHLDILPTIIGGAIQVAAGTTIRLSLKLKAAEHRVDESQGALHPGRIKAKYPSELRLVISPSGAQLEGLASAEVKLFGTNILLQVEPGVSPTYDQSSDRIFVPYTPSARDLVAGAQSSEVHISGTAKIDRAAWALRVARPPALPTLGEAAGAGELAFFLHAGLKARWGRLSGFVRLGETQLFVEPSGSTLRAKGVNDHGGSQRFDLWPHARSRQRRCNLRLDYRGEFPLNFRIEENTAETLARTATCLARLDRPVSVDGAVVGSVPLDCGVRSVSVGGIALGILVKHIGGAASPILATRGIVFALRNALLQATSLDALFLFGSIDVAGDRLGRGIVTSLFRIAAILPILPDPYASNFEPFDQPSSSSSALLSSRTRWAEPDPVPDFSLHLMDFGGQDPGLRGLFPQPLAPNPPEPRPDNTEVSQEDAHRGNQLRATFNRALSGGHEGLLLLDLSGNADHFGVGLALQPSRDPPSQTLVRDLSLVTLARDVRAFTVPQIQWEPVWAIQSPNFPSPLVSANDGGRTLLGIDTVNLVPIDPAHVVESMTNEFQSRDPNMTAAALFTLPFGMKAVAAPLRHPVSTEPTVPDVDLKLVQPRNQEFAGGLQVSLTALDPLSTAERESPRLPGAAIQLRNGIDPVSGAYRGISVLADLVQKDVEQTFNLEFAPGSPSARVPVTRIDFSGYGASLFSHWRNPLEDAKTSQVYFDVFVGRTAHEVVQVRSVLYPWAVRVIRTITIERTSGGGVFRRDSGWVAESDGVFDFKTHTNGSVIETHPGVVKGVFNVRRIRDTTHIFERRFAVPFPAVVVRMAAVRFDADVLVADIAVGGANGFVHSVDQIGFVQITPIDNPLTPAQYEALLAAEGPLGGPVDCVIDIGRSGQKMRVTRVDVAAAGTTASAALEFAAAARGSLLLPKDGQWSFVRQPVDVSAECIPANPHTGVSLVRLGRRTQNEATNTAPYLLAEPADLLVPGRSGFNAALLWAMGTQSVLFARPHVSKGTRAVKSMVPPLLADPLATAATSALFPSALACLKIPFPNYSLDIFGEGQFRLSLPAFATQLVSGGARRQLSRGVPTSIFADYTDTRFTIKLDPAAVVSWSYEQSGVKIVHERNGLEAMTSQGAFRASSSEATRWILWRQVFGDAFAEAKDLLPLLKNGISSPVAGPPGGAIMIPRGNDTAPLSAFKKAERNKFGVHLEFAIPENIPLLIGRTDGGKVEISFLFEKFFKLEVLLEFRLFELFPGKALLKYEAEQLERHIGSNLPNVGVEEKLILAIGFGTHGSFRPVPFVEVEVELFIGIGFAQESRPDRAEVGIAIVFQISGSAKCLPEETIVEAGIKVEGLGLFEERGGKTVIVCKGTLSIEITVAFLLDIDWEVADWEFAALEI
jgi:hypothetical protein